ADAFEVNGAIRQRIATPRVQKHVLDCAQAEQGRIDFRDAEHNEARACALDLTGQFLLNLLRGDGFKARMHHRIACRIFGSGAMLGHRVTLRFAKCERGRDKRVSRSLILMKRRLWLYYTVLLVIGFNGGGGMVEMMMIDLKALLVEREDCDAGTVQQLRNALGQGGTQYRSLRDVTEILKKRLEASTGVQAKRWHLKLGIALYFLGHTQPAVEHLKQAEGALANFYLGRALASRQEFDEALKAFERAEKAGYTSTQVQLQRAGIYRQKSDVHHARQLLAKLEDLGSHSAEYHFQLASCYLTEGEHTEAIKRFERAIELDPNHTGALFQLGHANDLAGNDEDAIGLYERCLQHPPI